MIANANYEDLAAASGGQLHGGSAAGPVGGGAADKRTYYGKCQYKTGKCFNERTLKRNGDAHSLCEEHRIKQNLIQRRSDRKYQTVHAIRRRERSQRRAVLKKQVSMAVAQQLFYEHQQQKSIGMQQLSAGHPLSVLAPAHGHSHALHHSHQQPHHHPLLSVASLAPPIQIPGKMDLSHFVSGSPASFLSSAEGLASPILSFAAPPSASSRSSFIEEAVEQQRDHKMEDDDGEDEDEDDDGEACEDDDEDDEDEQEDGRSRSRRSSSHLQPPQHQQSRLKQTQQTQQSAADHVKEENASPTGIDDFAPDSFLSICASEEESDAAYANLVPIMSTMGEKEMWTEDDIEFLQNLLLA
ncbi:hypothetical protein Gpo141_00007627 [Globisporangium polare]